jgi:hypothetical protein
MSPANVPHTQLVPATPVLLPAADILSCDNHTAPPSTPRVSTAVEIPVSPDDAIRTEAFIKSIFDTDRLAAATEETPPPSTARSLPATSIHGLHTQVSPDRIEQMFKDAMAMNRDGDEEEFHPIHELGASSVRTDSG